MNSRALFVSAVIVCASFAGITQADDNTSSQTIPTYHYGMPLHVGKIISLTEPNTLECQVVTATVKYIDEQTGKPAELAYRKFSDACSFQS
jgi:hypothetical protein